MFVKRELATKSSDEGNASAEFRERKELGSVRLQCRIYSNKRVSVQLQAPFKGIERVNSEAKPRSESRVGLQVLEALSWLGGGVRSMYL